MCPLLVPCLIALARQFGTSLTDQYRATVSGCLRQDAKMVSSRRRNVSSRCRATQKSSNRMRKKTAYASMTSHA